MSEDKDKLTKLVDKLDNHMIRVSVRLWYITLILDLAERVIRWFN